MSLKGKILRIKSFVCNHFIWFLVFFVLVFLMRIYFIIELFVAGNPGSLLSGMGTFLIGVSSVGALFYWQKGVKEDQYKKKSDKYDDLLYKLKQFAGEVSHLIGKRQKKQKITNYDHIEARNSFADASNCNESSCIISREIKIKVFAVLEELNKAMRLLIDLEPVELESSLKLIDELEQQMRKELFL